MDAAAPSCATPDAADARATGGQTTAPPETGTIRADCAPTPVIIITRPPGAPAADDGVNSRVRGPSARAMIDHANRRRLTEVTIEAAQGGQATVIIGTIAQQAPSPGAQQPPSPGQHIPQHDTAIRFRINEAALRAIQAGGGNAAVIVIAPTTAGAAALRPTATIAPGSLTDTTQKRLLEAAIRQADAGKAVLFLPPTGSATATTATGHLLPDRHGANRARLREAALKALHDGRTEQTIIILDAPR